MYIDDTYLLEGPNLDDRKLAVQRAWQMQKRFPNDPGRWWALGSRYLALYDKTKDLDDLKKGIAYYKTYLSFGNLDKSYYEQGRIIVGLAEKKLAKLQGN